MSNSHPRIAIIGAGPAGLTLGVLLHKRGVPFTIFELRQKPTDEELAKPSGMLDLHDESGIAAIRECGLYDQFLQLTGECSEAQKVSDKDGNILYEDDGGPTERPEISRHSLTKLLISQLPTETIQWGHKLISADFATETSRDQVELDFGSFGKQTFDLVVGSDGAWSKIRPLLTDVKPHYSGTHKITLTIRQITRKYPDLATLVGSGSFSALAFKDGVMSQRGPQDSARIYIFLSNEDEQFSNTSGLIRQTAAAAKSKLLDDNTLIGRWGPTIQKLVAAACEEESIDNPGAELDIKTLYMLPVGSTWEHKSNATLIGDAAHLMCPWAGEGVNLAMWDSLLLAHAIIEAYEQAGHDTASFHSIVDPSIKEFETEMFTRTAEKAEETVRNGKMLFAEDGAKEFTDFFLSVCGPPEEAS